MSLPTTNSVIVGKVFSFAMRTPIRFALLTAVVLVSATGCRFKGFEGFTKATSPREEEAKELNFGASAKDPARAEWGKYSGGGVADASGGQIAKTHYGEGARTGGAVMPGFDEPTKGTGQQAGENPGVGHTNAPANQPKPSELGR